MTSHHDAVSDDLLSPAERLAAACADLARRCDLGDRLAQARAALAEARTERAALAASAEQEEADVERLSGSSASALWSRLRGRLDDDLSRERSEHEQARAALDAADAWLRALRSDVDDLVEQSSELVDADAREQAALEDLARAGAAWDGLDPAAVAQARAEVDRRRKTRELDLALATGAGLLQSLDRVLTLAASLSGHAVLDTHDLAPAREKLAAIDELRPHVEAANDGLQAFASRVRALGVPDDLPQLSSPRLDRRARAIDEWLDDPVTDALVLGEARQVIMTVRTAIDRTERAVAYLRARRDELPPAKAV
jgi:chromosome segregation ATPase